MDKPSYVYILASAPYGTIYIGSTTDLIQRVWQHREELIPGFTKSYHVHMLVWYEIHSELGSAAAREKHMKKWKRAWKLDFVSTKNPTWRDLYCDIVG
jgi:putative endonuclease